MATTKPKSKHASSVGRRRRKNRGWSVKKKYKSTVVTYEYTWKSLWEIKGILEEKVIDGTLHYLVDWVGTDPDTGLPWDPTWRPASEVLAPECLKSWEAEKLRRRLNMPHKKVIIPRTSKTPSSSPEAQFARDRVRGEEDGEDDEEEMHADDAKEPVADGTDVRMDVDLPNPEPQDFSAELEANLAQLESAPSASASGPFSLGPPAFDPPTPNPATPAAADDDDPDSVELYYPPDDVIEREQDLTRAHDLDLAAAFDFNPTSFDLVGTSAVCDTLTWDTGHASPPPCASPTLPPAAPFLTGGRMTPSPELIRAVERGLRPVPPSPTHPRCMAPTMRSPRARAASSRKKTTGMGSGTKALGTGSGRGTNAAAAAASALPPKPRTFRRPVFLSSSSSSSSSSSPSSSRSPSPSPSPSPEPETRPAVAQQAPVPSSATQHAPAPSFGSRKMSAATPVTTKTPRVTTTSASAASESGTVQSARGAPSCTETNAPSSFSSPSKPVTAHHPHSSPSPEQPTLEPFGQPPSAEPLREPPTPSSSGIKLRLKASKPDASKPSPASKAPGTKAAKARATKAVPTAKATAATNVHVVPVTPKVRTAPGLNVRGPQPKLTFWLPTLAMVRARALPSPPSSSTSGTARAQKGKEAESGYVAPPSPPPSSVGDAPMSNRSTPNARRPCTLSPELETWDDHTLSPSPELDEMADNRPLSPPPSSAGDALKAGARFPSPPPSTAEDTPMLDVDAPALGDEPAMAVDDAPCSASEGAAHPRVPPPVPFASTDASAARKQGQGIATTSKRRMGSVPRIDLRAMGRPKHAKKASVAGRKVRFEEGAPSKDEDEDDAAASAGLPRSPPSLGQDKDERMVRMEQMDDADTRMDVDAPLSTALRPPPSSPTFGTSFTATSTSAVTSVSLPSPSQEPSIYANFHTGASLHQAEIVAPIDQPPAPTAVRPEPIALDSPFRRVTLGFPAPRKTPTALTHSFGL